MHKDEKESPWLETSTKAMVQKFDSFMMSQNYIKTNEDNFVYVKHFSGSNLIILYYMLMIC